MRKFYLLFAMLLCSVGTWADGLQQAKAGSTAITSITSGNDYIIKCSGQASQVTYMYDNNGTINATTNLPTGPESMKYVWTITLNADNTTYTVQNKKTGKQITFESTEDNGAVTTSDAGTAITIEYNGNVCGMKNSSNQYIDMKYSGQGSCTWSGTVASSKAMTILEANLETIPTVSTESSKTYYTFKSKRNNTKYAQYKGDATQLGMTDSYVPSILWYVTSGSTTGTYKLHNYETTKLYAGTSSFTDAGVDVYIAASSYNDGYCVVSTQENLGGNCWDAQGSGTKIGTWGHSSGDNEGTSWLIAEASISELKATFNTLLTSIKTNYIDKEGDALGQYSSTDETYSALKTQYTTSKGVYDNASATLEQIAAAYDALNNIAKPICNNLSARGIYKLTSAYTAAASDNVVLVDNGNSNNYAAWLKTADVSSTTPYEAQWILNPITEGDNAGTITFRNLYTGKYIAYGSSNFTMSADAPSYFMIDALGDDQYSFTVKGTTNRMHCRAISEVYSGSEATYYKGGTSEAYWIMPVSGNAANSGQAWTLTQIAASEADLLAISDFARTEAQTYLAKVGDNPYDYTSASTATLQGMVTTAETYLTGVKTSDEISDEVTTITNDKAAAIAALAKTGFLNTAYYTIKSQPNPAQYLRYDGENNYASAKGTAEDNANRQWAICTVDGKKYVYNMGAEKFLSFNSSGDKNTYWVLDASTIKAFSITEATGAAAFNFKQEDKGSDTYLHYSGWYTYYTTNWYEGSSSSNQASMWVIEKAGDFTSEQQTALVDKIQSGVALTTLTELVTATKANYYDSWNSSWRLSQTGLNSYWYINEPEEGMKLDEYLTTAETFLNGSEEKTTSACNTYITNINAILANLTINTPKVGSFIRVRNASDKRYLQCTESAKTGRAAFGDTGADAIFYYDGTHMLGYNNGLYAVLSSNFWGVGAAGATGMSVSFVQANDGTIGQYNVVFNDNRALYSQTSTVDENTVYHTDAGSYSASGKLTDVGYKYWLEEVTELPLTIGSTGYATFSAPVKVTPSAGYTASIITEVGGYAKLSEQSDAIPANTGVIIKGALGTCTMTITDTEAFSATGNKLVACVAATNVTKADNTYFLANGTNGLGFYHLTANGVLSGHKAYLQTSASQSVREFIGFGDDETAIDNIEVAPTQDGKYLQNGKIMIIKNGKKYNVAGQMVK